MNVDIVELSNNLSTSQKEAYINEYKGLVFEYLVGMECLEGKNVAQFYSEIPASYLQRLSYAAEQIRRHDQNLYSFLKLAALQTAKVIIEHISGQSFDTVSLQGKLLSDHSNLLKVQSECDILLIDSKVKGEIYPLSLKFCKKDSFVNTKSAGIKTFVAKYFGPFEGSHAWQSQLNQVVADAFLQMSKDLHKAAKLPYDPLSPWTEYKKNYSQLPGEVPAHFQKIILQFYHTVLKSTHLYFKQMAENNFELFCALLLPLCGLMDPKLSQVICHYQKKGDLFFIDEVKWQDLDFFRNELSCLKIEELRPHLASFEITMKSKVFQLRLKPMNVYTVPGLKVNCSLKDLN